MDQVELYKLEMLCEGLWCPSCDEAIQPEWGCSCTRRRLAGAKAADVIAWEVSTAKAITDEGGKVPRVLRNVGLQGLSMSARQEGRHLGALDVEARRASARVEFNTGPKEWTPRRPPAPSDIPFRG